MQDKSWIFSVHHIFFKSAVQPYTQSTNQEINVTLMFTT